MKFTNPFVVLTSRAVALLAIHIGVALSMNYEPFATSFGFKDITINETVIKHVEFVLVNIHQSGSCSGEFVLASQSILRVFPEELKDDWYCLIGVRHEANMSEPLLTTEEASNVTFVIERIKKLDFYWLLDGKKIELTNVDDVHKMISTSKDTHMLKRAYNTILKNGRIVVVTDDAQARDACCMRNPFLHASKAPSYPKFPAFGIGRHDVTLNGHLFKNVPYIWTNEIFCPYGMKDAIVTVKAFPEHCLVSVAFVGSPTLLHGEDPNDIKVKRSRFQWIIDGKPAGIIPDELWNDFEPNSSFKSFESLQNASIFVSKDRLYVNLHHSLARCCMDLTQEETTSTTTNKH